MNKPDEVFAEIAAATTFLFTPATRPDRLTKAVSTACGLVIADLEDAVATSEKDSARRSLSGWLDEHPEHWVLVRVNASGTPWHTEDLRLCRHSGVIGVVLPKTERVRDVEHAHTVSGKLVLPIIETPLGIGSLDRISRAFGVARHLFGKLDLGLSLNLTADDSDPEELVFLPHRAKLVLESCLAKLPPPVDGIFTAINDLDGLERYARRAKNHGFGGVLLIHPGQIETVAGVFTPTREETAWAEKVMAAVTASGGSAVSLDGEMIDAPVIARARRVLGLG